MGRKKGVIVCFFLIAAISILLTGCVIVENASSAKKEQETSPTQQEDAKNSGIQPKPALATASSCDDSTDGGNNPYKLGATQVIVNNKATTFKDTCASSGYLTEYYCDGKEYKFYSKLCTYGCSNGACLQQEVQQVVEEPEPVVEEEPPTPVSIPECFNGYRDLQETGMDCGGPNCTPCGYGKPCKIKRDCVAPLTCSQRNFLCMDKGY